jgi:hypothetical protein
LGPLERCEGDTEEENVLRVNELVSWMWFVVVLIAPLRGAQTEGQERIIVQTQVLRQEANGVSGTLQLLLDTRLTAPVREELWGVGDWSLVLAPESATYKAFANRPPINALLRVVDVNGSVVSKRELERPLAKLEEWDSVSSRNRWFLLTEDLSAGFGSYSGRATNLVEVKRGSIHEVEALDSDSHRKERFRLMKALRSDWRITRRDSGGEILSVSSHPKDSLGFVTEYLRYSYDGHQWQVFKREVAGSWTSDEPFPQRAAFR